MLSSAGFTADAVPWTTGVASLESPTTQAVADVTGVTQATHTSTDLLQQAMNEVNPGTAVSYMDQTGQMIYMQEDGKLVSLDGILSSGSVAVMSAPHSTVMSAEPSEASTVDISGLLYKNSNTDSVREYVPTLDDVGENPTSSLADMPDNGVTSGIIGTGPVAAACPVTLNNINIAQTQAKQADGNPSLLSSVNSQYNSGPGLSEAVQDTAPLGSSRNPIRIIQRGNQFTAMQHLTPDQLAQIVQVIKEQQEQTQSKNQSTPSSAVLYNPDGASQSVYRICSASSSASHMSGSETSVQMIDGSEHYHQRRIARKRKLIDEDRIAGNEWSRQEKEERKKHRPRTRSGRVSKPPQYMVKDYKHIHPVDYDEDYDDSDGGYSDFKHSGDERSSEDRQLKDDDGHWKHNKCDTCEKRYIGLAGLARHYRLYPTHGSIPTEHHTSELFHAESSSDGQSLQDCAVNDCLSVAHNTPQVSDTPATVPTSDASQPAVVVKKRGRGRPPLYNVDDKRRAQLREIIERCSTDDLLRVALPKLAGVASIWDFLAARLPKTETMTAADVCNMLVDYDKFRTQVKTICEDRLSLVDETGLNNCAREEASGPVLSKSEATDSAVTWDTDTDRVTTKYYEGSTSSPFVFGATHKSSLKLTSDIAESLGLAAGQYKYTVQQHNIAMSSANHSPSELGHTVTDIPTELPPSETSLGDGKDGAESEDGDVAQKGTKTRVVDSITDVPAEQQTCRTLLSDGEVDSNGDEMTRSTSDTGVLVTSEAMNMLQGSGSDRTGNNLQTATTFTLEQTEDARTAAESKIIRPSGGGLNTTGAAEGSVPDHTGDDLQTHTMTTLDLTSSSEVAPTSAKSNAIRQPSDSGLNTRTQAWDEAEQSSSVGGPTTGTDACIALSTALSEDARESSATSEPDIIRQSSDGHLNTSSEALDDAEQLLTLDSTAHTSTEAHMFIATDGEVEDTKFADSDKNTNNSGYIIS